jgi:aminopeptidase N
MLALAVTVASQTKDQPRLGTITEIDDGAALCAAAKSAAFSRLDRSAARSAYSIASINTDMTYYHLDLEIDLAGQHLDGVVRVEGTVVGTALSTLMLDLLSNMIVSSVQLSDGTPLSYSQGGDAVIITMPASIPVGGTFEVDITYGGTPSTGGFGYFRFGTNGDGDLFAWSLSEPYGSRNWWPCKDHPFDKSDSVRVTVTVPSQYKVGSQGTLASTTVDGGNTTYDWVSDYPISTYLVSIAVGEYVEYLGAYNRSPALASLHGSLSMPLQHLVYDDGSPSLFSAWADVGFMLDAFENWFGPYPFADEKYGHSECTFGGGMEHQTMSSMGPYNYLTLVSHELAHQWYGDVISPKTWPHLWLNEGFATYAELVDIEERPGAYSPGYFEIRRLQRYNYARSASGTLVLEDTTNVSNMFSYYRVYAKGATVLHMLRTVVGDTTFKDILREYALDPAVRYGVAETDDFKRVAETESGMDLDQFFSQWVTDGTGYPTYRMSANWYPASGGYTVDVAVGQTQRLPESNVEVFEMPLTIAVQTLSGEERFVVQNDQQIQMFELSVASEPTSVAIDPDEVILRSSTIATGIGDTPALSVLTLHSLTPNPTRNSLVIEFGTVEATNVAIDVYDVAGRRVLSRSVESAPAGVQFQTLDTSTLATGVYFLRIHAFEGQATRKFVVVR